MNVNNELKAYHSSNPRVEVVWAPQPGSQEAFLSCPYDEVLYEGNRGPGKCSPLDSKVLTPHGWTTIGALKVGSVVQTPRGHGAMVTHVFEFDSKPIYRITMEDGASMEASDEHLWKFKATGLARKGVSHNWHINDTMRLKKLLEKGYHVLLPTVEPQPSHLHPRMKKLPVDPYLLGLILGDGYSQVSESGRLSTISYCTVDEDLREYVESQGFVAGNSKTSHRIHTLALAKKNDVYGVRKGWMKLKLGGTKAATKFVPTWYKMAPIEDRLAVLQGLMDTDGTCDPKGYCSFTSVSPQLANDVKEIVWSLGGKATVTRHPSYLNGERKQDHYDVYIQPAGKFTPFRLKRKIDRIQPYMHKELTRRIKSIEYVGDKPARCIRIDDLEHLYIADDYIVTHNTDALLMDYLQDVGKGYGEDWNGILFRRTFPELQDVIKKSLKWFRKIFPDAKYNAAKHVWTFRGGEKLTFAFMSVVADYDQYHGHEYPWIAWEELTNWATLDCYLKMMSTSRTSNPNIRRRIRATCNPSGIGHNVVKARWQLPNAGGKMIGKPMQDEPDEDTEPGTVMPVRVAIHGDLSENKILLHANPNYRNTIAVSATSEAQKRAWLYGDWEITSGGMFDDIWKKKYHVIPTMDPRTFPAGWKLDRSYDHGQSRPFSVGFWAESNGEPLHVPGYGMVGQVPGDLIRFSEWYGFTGEANKGIRMTARDIGKGVRERVRDFGVRIQPGVADSSIFDQWEPDKTVAGQMRRVGIRWLKADKSAGSRKQGWQEIRERLEGAIPDETGYREQKGLFVMENCVQFIRTVPVLPRDDRDMDDVDTESEDHIGDEVRYRCRAKGPKVMTVRKG